MSRWIQTVGAALVAVVTSSAAAQPYILLEPVRDAAGKAVVRPDEKGVPLPVLQQAGGSDVARQARAVLTTGFAAHVPAIDAAARQAAKVKAQCPALPEAVYVFLSDEDGGYARHRFFVARAAGEPVLCDDHFIDLTADEVSIASGEFEEVLAHEWGHVLLRRLLGPVPPTPSRKFHSVRTVTDPVTAFDEGFGIHFQPLSARLTETPGYRARIEGTAEPRLADFWFSRQETWMRQALVPQNRLVFDKDAPAPDSDAYARWFADEVSAAFAACRLQSGDQMVASEGMVASFLHKLLAADPTATVGRYQQLIAVLSRMGGWPTQEPAILAFVKAWGDVYPEEREDVFRLFIASTHAATVSRQARSLQEKAACAGSAGDIETFLAARKDAQAALDAAVADAVADNATLGAALGPGLWLANPDVRTVAAPWQGQRSQPLVANLNTARASELALLFSGTPLAGKAEQIVRARDAGPFQSLEDAVRKALLAPADLQRLRQASDAFRQIGGAVRK